jgi:hypothetical protein
LSSSLLTLRRTIAAVGVASLAFVAIAPTAGASTTSSDKKATIDTYSGWDGVSYLFPFGNPETSNYGQVITIPEGKSKLKSYTFYMAANSGTGTLTMRGEVYGWDGTMATTKVAQSKKKTLDLTAGDTTYYPVKIKVKKGNVSAGSQYVLFLTVDKDYEANPPSLLSQWACNYSDVLPGGSTVYLNSDGDESQWTTVPWSQISTFDMAMKATLK